MWNLDLTLGEFILPRLKAFAKVTNGYPPYHFDDRDRKMTFGEWHEILKKMIIAFEIIVSDDNFCLTPEQLDQKDEGLRLFSLYYSSLWT
jgi:hypothetical protein